MVAAPDPVALLVDPQVLGGRLQARRRDVDLGARRLQLRPAAAVSDASTWRRASAAVETAASAVVEAFTMFWSRWNPLKIG